MKKVMLFVAVVGTIGMTSCKKDYTCECTGEGDWSYSVEFENVKKKDAETACEGNNTSYAAFGASCELK